MRQRMMITAWAAILWALIPGSAWCAEDGATEKASWEEYSIVSEMNIFSRTRRVRTATPKETVTQQAPEVVRTEESYLVLRGVVQEKEVFISFIEDSRTGAVNRVQEGEAVGGGTLADATLDFVSYRLGEDETRIAVGMTFEGKIPESSSSQYVSGDSYYPTQENFEFQQTTSASETAVVSDDEAKDILQRLKERRKKELGE